MTARLPLFNVAERRGRPARDAVLDETRRVPPLLYRDRSGARQYPVAQAHAGEISDDDDLGREGIVRSSRTITRPARSSSAPAEPASALPRSDARTPAAQITVLAPMRPSTPFDTVVTPFSSTGRDGRSSRNGDAEPLEGPLRPSRQRRRVRRKEASIASMRTILVSLVSISLKSLASVETGKLRERTGELDARRAAADDRERHPGAAFLGGVPALRLLERGEDPSADFDGVFDRLQAGRVARPLVVSEIMVVRSRGDDESVVRNPPVGEQDLTPLRVDPRDLGLQHTGVAGHRPGPI